MKKRLKNLLWYGMCSLIFLIVIFGADRMINVLSMQEAQRNIPTIIIDAGHGGEDGGASTATGVPESRINLEIAVKLNDLCRLVGWKTKMIRRDDRSIYTQGNTLSEKKVSDLKQRVQICNSTPNAVLLSLHQNFFSDGKYRGTQVFYADTLNSKILAQYIQSTVCKDLQKDNHRNIKKATGIYLMDNIQCTGVLVECGFLSNAEEAMRLQNQDYQMMLCCALVSSYNCYLEDSGICLDPISFH